MTKHFPGPWNVTQDGRHVGNFERDMCVLVANTDIGGLSHDKQQANARLIAAAPDLLEACKMLEEAEDHYHNECDECQGEGEPELCSTCFPLFDNARLARRSAIEKAESGGDDGKTPEGV